MNNISESDAIKIATSYLAKKSSRVFEFSKAKLIDKKLLESHGFVPPAHQDHWLISFLIMAAKYDFDEDTWNWMSEKEREIMLSKEHAGSMMVKVDAATGEAEDFKV